MAVPLYKTKVSSELSKRNHAGQMHDCKLVWWNSKIRSFWKEKKRDESRKMNFRFFSVISIVNEFVGPFYIRGLARIILAFGRVHYRISYYTIHLQSLILAFFPCALKPSMHWRHNFMLTRGFRHLNNMWTYAVVPLRESMKNSFLQSSTKYLRQTPFPHFNVVLY